MRNLILKTGGSAILALTLVSLSPAVVAQEAYRTSVNFSILPTYNGEDTTQVMAVKLSIHLTFKRIKQQEYGIILQKKT